MHSLHFLIVILSTVAMVNLAQGRQCSQISVAHSGTPDLAVDGDKSSTCCETQKHREPWWMVDLGRPCSVHHVNLAGGSNGH